MGEIFRQYLQPTDGIGGNGVVAKTGPFGFFMYGSIDWKKHVVWVELKDRHKVAEIVKDFHSTLSPQKFIDLQLANRKLWEDKLTLGGFFQEFFNNRGRSL